MREKEKRSKKTGFSTTALDILQRRHEDLDWVAENEPRLQREYNGEVIAVYRKEVVAHGHDLTSVLADASRQYPTEELVTVTLLAPEAEFAPDTI